MPPVRDLLVGRWLGHPLHAVLTDAPIGVLFLVIVFDVLGQVDAATSPWPSASWRCSARRSPGSPTTPTPTAGARAGDPPRDADGRHPRGVPRLAAPIRLGSGSVANAAAIWISIAAFLLLSAAAYVGGDVVYVLGNMVSRHALRGAGMKWVALEPAETDADGSIPEGRPRKAKLGINQLVLVRQGETILALHDTCAHAGGPLNEGRIVDGAIECPWHSSRYRLTDGLVLRGPSVYDQPAYEVRARDGGGWEARRQAH